MDLVSDVSGRPIEGSVAVFTYRLHVPLGRLCQHLPAKLPGFRQGRELRHVANRSRDFRWM